MEQDMTTQFVSQPQRKMMGVDLNKSDNSSPFQLPEGPTYGGLANAAPIDELLKKGKFEIGYIHDSKSKSIVFVSALLFWLTLIKWVLLGVFYIVSTIGANSSMQWMIGDILVSLGVLVFFCGFGLYGASRLLKEFLFVYIAIQVLEIIGCIVVFSIEESAPEIGTGVISIILCLACLGLSFKLLLLMKQKTPFERSVLVGRFNGQFSHNFDSAQDKTEGVNH